MKARGRAGKQKENKDNEIVQEREFCRICGSANIEPRDSGFACMNCGAFLPRSKKAKTRIKKTPRYIG